MKRVILPAWNWERNLGSLDQKRRMSGILNKSIAIRSRPRPKAQPIRCGTPEELRSSCLTTPQPSSSSHSPCQKTSSSKDGLVKGKYASIHLIFKGSCIASGFSVASLAAEKILMTSSSRDRLRWAVIASASSAV
ncbi:hypothetical protein H113_05859 [Trichophyton rubrum MR1459]|uniref:Uncharacterized protein n=1 Tax=Trichophyton rubrum (strain ATCC MYA-4607 / CBS 118892) TaxID=559305 RepID=A0A080WIN7_TRIRC|nr:uncharacterized protein TERG_12008 [Trichophyton rubrum CBS 118892]EZF93700.1 hypothetical protein H113_05859 [Trichophyton rubrum MR1459]EZG04781.1 hypothetical protein H106_05655 [Trichophyton rubrum CBS 735.88]KFL61224.1 hypothetical protein TERG_12008 [Trichophyton rubrum CBS 118892]